MRASMRSSDLCCKHGDLSAQVGVDLLQASSDRICTSLPDLHAANISGLGNRSSVSRPAKELQETHTEYDSCDTKQP